MKTIPVFKDGQFHGYYNYAEVFILLNDSHELAKIKQKTENADYMIFGYFDTDKDGNTIAARFYSGIAKTEKEFENISLLDKSNIYAIHNSRVI